MHTIHIQNIDNWLDKWENKHTDTHILATEKQPYTKCGEAQINANIFKFQSLMTGRATKFLKVLHNFNVNTQAKVNIDAWNAKCTENRIKMFVPKLVLAFDRFAFRPQVTQSPTLHTVHTHSFRKSTHRTYNNHKSVLMCVLMCYRTISL